MRLLIFLVFLCSFCNQAYGRFCYITTDGIERTYMCSYYEHCCGNQCCEGFTIPEFYRIWYFWFCLVVVFMFCSGGGYWYRKRYYRQRTVGNNNIVNELQVTRSGVYGGHVVSPVTPYGHTVHRNQCTVTPVCHSINTRPICGVIEPSSSTPETSVSSTYHLHPPSYCPQHSPLLPPPYSVCVTNNQFVCTKDAAHAWGLNTQALDESGSVASDTCGVTARGIRRGVRAPGDGRGGVRAPAGSNVIFISPPPAYDTIYTIGVQSAQMPGGTSQTVQAGGASQTHSQGSTGGDERYALQAICQEPENSPVFDQTCTPTSHGSHDQTPGSAGQTPGTLPGSTQAAAVSGIASGDVVGATPQMEGESRISQDQ